MKYPAYARNIMGEEGFYPIIKKIDKTLLKTIEISGKHLLVQNVNAVIPVEVEPQQQ